MQESPDRTSRCRTELLTAVVIPFSYAGRGQHLFIGGEQGLFSSDRAGIAKSEAYAMDVHSPLSALWPM